MIQKYHALIEVKLKESVASLGPPSLLREACQYALMSGGKRLRPIIVLMLAGALKTPDIAEAALATEFFHTASLIADDLPCMDNEDNRRGKLALHKAYNEATALLTTYALIAAGYEKIRSAAPGLEALNQALESATKTTGILGATGGQFLDLFSLQQTPTLLCELIAKKTAALFELSFVLGWLYGGGESRLLPVVKELANHFGTAFQIKDDIADCEEDSANARVNSAVLLGKSKAMAWFEKEREKYHALLDKLPINTQELRELIETSA